MHKVSKKGYCYLLDEKFINTKLFEILEDLNNNREKLLLFKNKMNEHSDKDSVSKVGEFINKYLDEKKIKIGLKEKIHFIGIGGIGMSGLAQVMQRMGFDVQGSDLSKIRMLKGVKELKLKFF